MCISLIKLTIKAIFFSNESRFPRSGSAALNIDQVLAEMASNAPTLPTDKEFRDQILQEARNSLNEVKALTEYQDEKASRLLTAVAFLMAAAIGIFTKFVDIFPLVKYKYAASFGEFLVVAAYLSFAMYCLFSIWGTFLVFVGTQSRFLWGQGGFNAERTQVRSRLFFRSIIETKPDAWAKSFDCASDSGKEKEVAVDLLNSYYKNYVSETYLVASKVAEKLVYLEPAQLLLRASMIVLMTWGMLFGMAMEFSEPRGKDFVEVAVVKPGRSVDISGAPVDVSSGVDGGKMENRSGSVEVPIKIEITNHNDSRGNNPVSRIVRTNKVKEDEKRCDCSDGCRQHTVGHECSVSEGAK